MESISLDIVLNRLKEIKTTVSNDSLSICFFKTNVYMSKY